MEEGIKEIEEMEEKADEQHDDRIYGILGLTKEIRKQSEYRYHHAYLVRKARQE